MRLAHAIPALCIAAFALIVFLELRYTMIISMPSFLPDDANTKPRSEPRIPSSDIDVHDLDLAWYTPRPLSPRFVGWEDDYMRQFKETHYDPNQRLRCRVEESPYDDTNVCHVPAYIPARLVVNQPQKIPRAIFMSWKTRKLDRGLYISLLTILNHNPEYELFLFDDQDLDEFVCRTHPDLAADFSRLRSGAQRVDFWRMTILQLYGGVYLDMDMTSLAHLPISRHDDVVASTGGWSYVPGPGGVLEHWALAYRPHHPVIATTLELIVENLRNLTSDHIVGPAALEACDSYTIRLTGCAPFQRALQHWLRRASCKVVEDSFVPALKNPESHCNWTQFKSIFGTMAIGSRQEMNGTLTPKLLHIESKGLPGPPEDYDNESIVNPLNESVKDFCKNESVQRRREEWDRLWTNHSYAS